MCNVFPSRLNVAGLVVLLLGQAATCSAMTENELCDLYLGVTESAVDDFEPIWLDYSDKIPDTGFFDFSQYQNWITDEYYSAITVPGSGMVAYCYAVLLSYTDKQLLGQGQIPRATLLQRVRKVLRFCSMTSSYAEQPYPYPFPIEGHRRYREDGSWYRSIGSRIDTFGWLTLAAALLWDDLDEQTQQAMERLWVGNAAKKRHFRGWTRAEGGLHDTIKQDYAATIGAAFLFGHRDDRDSFYEIIAANGIGMVATEHDQACAILAQGQPVSDWSEGWNLYPD